MNLSRISDLVLRIWLRLSEAKPRQVLLDLRWFDRSIDRVRLDELGVNRAGVGSLNRFLRSLRSVGMTRGRGPGANQGRKGVFGVIWRGAGQLGQVGRVGRVGLIRGGGGREYPMLNNE